ncbi:blr7706 [Bradyrhizobium diazoefficiens USDA 110]|uniref:Blr7706 protein n=1 Tax=Bradyrhizobium diazoefficiens (strain JCM 10833 / BCRC 13528 / IAM 13628 / NBRC 14792 / USDA 110) TaxID=224911 RepID=Q89CT9_BRADU|nr:VOC family protein [Bradyrhizobium diazoefficiens]PDT55828.1 glyoxalase [Bradyrhizobium diazoefficiens]QBP26445.1 VOC family protein [Bradyrhizobium diazoefficiens]WLA75123.1 VOC family protein [Bradyrhizobium diazoefficiens]WLB39554.1 VOC family protein [Bradyrhizobium diazoefficiens]WLC15472.1 VOC family protein [Bradyrhizobium diazoefficiens]
MIHHVSLGSNDVNSARAFYDPLMSLLGLRLLKHSDRSLHYGASDIIFSIETPIDGLRATAGNGTHVAFQAPDRETVRASARPHLRLEALTKGLPASETITTRIILVPSYATSMETRLRR